MMVVGRVLGDRVVDRFGARAVARSGSLLAALGMAADVTGPTPLVIIVGFALSGLGASTLFPLGFAAAGDIPGGLGAPPGHAARKEKCQGRAAQLLRIAHPGWSGPRRALRRAAAMAEEGSPGHAGAVGAAGGVGGITWR